MASRRLTLVSLATVALAGLPGCADTPSAPGPTLARPPVDAVARAAPTKAGKIAFIKRLGFDQWLYIMNADGSGATRVSTAAYAYEADPTWSPDYRSMLYIDYWATKALNSSRFSLVCRRSWS